MHNICTDNYWGCGPNLKGLNTLGILLEKVRDHLKTKQQTQKTEQPAATHIKPGTYTTRNVLAPSIAPTNTSPSATQKTSPPNNNHHASRKCNTHNSPILILGNSNTRQMANILAHHQLDAESYCYPGGTSLDIYQNSFQIQEMYSEVIDDLVSIPS